MTEVEQHLSVDLPSASIARAIIRSLSRGTTIGSGARYFHVGHEKWLAAQNELLGEIAEDSHAETKFVRGAYGAGKSHFLAVVQDSARSHDWATSHVECKTDGVQIDRFETLYPRIVAKIDAIDIRDTVDTDTAVDPVRFVLEKWMRQLMVVLGVRDDGLSRPFDIESRLHTLLERNLLRSNLPPNFIRALCSFARASVTGDAETTRMVCRWISGENERIRLPDSHCQRPAYGRQDGSTTELRPIGKGSAIEAMRGVLWLIRAAGYAGLVLCIDEIEELAKLGSRKRQDQALQALREFVDHAGGEGGFSYLCVYLAATPEMFEGESYFPRYDALATRIQAVSSEVNWRSPVIDLDSTPLAINQLRKLAERICDIHAIGYRNTDTDRQKAIVEEAVAIVSDARFRVARPRLLARMIVDHLERSRQAGHSFSNHELREKMKAAATRVAGEDLA